MNAHEARLAPVAGNAAAGLAGLLSSLGITDSATRTSVEDDVLAELEARGFHAQVKELRWGTLTLLAGPQDATLLRFDQDSIMAALESKHPGAVKHLRINVARTR